MRFIRKVLFPVAIAGGILGFLYYAVFLQELAKDQLPEVARGKGLSLPFREPRLEVKLQTMRMTLYDGETVVKHYDIGFGPKVAGRSFDRVGSTPLGEFRIIGKHRQEDVYERGSRFLEIDFPNPEVAEAALAMDHIGEADYERIARASAIGAPVGGTPLGGPVGIQGNFFPFRDRRFTDGSVAVSNADINELYEHLPVGTRVLITM